MSDQLFGEETGRSDESVQIDPRLLADAAAVLRAANFEIREELLSSIAAPWLLAENPYFLVAVVAGAALTDLRILEDHATSALSSLTQREDLGAKRWDAHLVLLAAHDEETGSPTAAADIRNDLRALRRILATGIAARPQRLRSALAAFLPLPRTTSADEQTPLAELEAALVVNGVAKDAAARAIAAFEQSGNLNAL